MSGGTLDGLAALFGDTPQGHAPIDLDGVAISTTLAPASEDALCRSLAALTQHGLAAVPRGGGSQLGLGNAPSRADCFLSLEALRGVDSFDRSEGVCHVAAGTPLEEVRAVVAEGGWELPLEGAVRGGSVGGALATASLGPRALGFGRPRDVVLGYEVALANGTRTRCGGRVVKNVTGYDLGKLYTGSCGSLAVILAAWLRLRPRPQHSESLRIEALNVEEACGHGIEIARRTTTRACSLLEADAGLSTVVELAGDAASVARDCDWLTGELGAEATEAADTDAVARRRWSLLEPPGLRFAVSSRPKHLAACAKSLRSAGARLLVLPGLPLVIAEFAAAEPEPDAVFESVQRAAAAAGGRACCESAPLEAKRGRDVFGAPAPEARLARALKARFDPAATLSPGRFAGGV